MMLSMGAILILFLSTLSLRRATFPAPPTMWSTTNFYPRSPCGERRDPEANSRAKRQISIHALLAESDKQHCNNLPIKYVFLSTLSLRRATGSRLYDMSAA